MANAKRDENRVTVALGVSNDDDVTTLPIEVDSSTNRVLIDFTNGVASISAIDSVKRDENRIPTVYGISNDDGETLIPIRTNEDGYLLAHIG